VDLTIRSGFLLAEAKTEGPDHVDGCRGDSCKENKWNRLSQGQNGGQTDDEQMDGKEHSEDPGPRPSCSDSTGGEEENHGQYDTDERRDCEDKHDPFSYVTE
jgi:hypothetical protein